MTAALEVTGINVGIWLWCRYIREGGANTGFRIGIQSWKDNLLNGFEWDDNHFNTNQLAHPYHGSMYFCSARANGRTGLGVEVEVMDLRLELAWFESGPISPGRRVVFSWLRPSRGE